MRLPLTIPDQASFRFDAAGFGLNMTDLLVVVREHPVPGSKQPVRQFSVRPGGQAATAMTACSRLGWRARYIGCFGDDAHGEAGIRSLEEAGVDVSASKTVDGAANGTSVILVDERSGERTVLWWRDPKLAQRPDDVSRADVCSARVLLVDCHDTAASTVAARYARQCGIPTVVDVEHVRPGIDELLHEIDVIITAQTFPSQLTGISDTGRAIHAVFQRYRPALACATLGPQGSVAVAAEGEIRTPGFKVAAVDTTGAGDVFRGGFIAGWLRDGPAAQVESVLRYAHATAALKCRMLGAREGIPTAREVDAFLEDQQN